MRIGIVVLCGLIVAPRLAQATVPNQFSVQGVLRDGAGRFQNLPVNLTVKLWNDPTATDANNLLGTPISTQPVMASNGLFTVPINLDSSLMANLAGASQIWLEVTAGNDTFARQPVTPQLFALMCGTADVARSYSGSTLGVGTMGNSGRIIFYRASDGVEAGDIGFSSNQENNVLEINSQGGGGTLTLNTNAAERMRITSDGNVGIGTPKPGAHLDVSGELQVTNGGANVQLVLSNGGGGQKYGMAAVNDRLFIGRTNGVGQVVSPDIVVFNDGHITATVTSPSDARLKTNVHTIDRALDKILSLRGVTFNWKSDGAPSLGVIAQELEKVFPQLVSTDANGFKTVAYPNLVGVLIEATRELKQDHDRLALDNQRLAKQNAELMARLGRLESTVERWTAAASRKRGKRVAAR